MAYDEGLAERIWQVLEDHRGVEQKKMFGGLCFLVNGNMACGVVGSELMVRVGLDGYESGLAEKHTREMTFTGRALKGRQFIRRFSVLLPPRPRTFVGRGLLIAGAQCVVKAGTLIAAGGDMQLQDKVLSKVFDQLTAGGAKRLTPAGAQKLIDVAKDPRDLQTILDSFKLSDISEVGQLIKDHIASTQAQISIGGGSPMLVKMGSLGSSSAARTMTLRDDAPHHNRAFDQALTSLDTKQRAQCLELGINSLSTFQFVHANRNSGARGSITLIESLFAKLCTCAGKIHEDPLPKPVKTPKVDIAGYGEIRAPRARTFPRDPLFIGMSDVIAGATIELRNRSKGINVGQIQPWISLPVDTVGGVRAEDGRMHIAIGPGALRKLGLDAWDQFEIRQRLPDGRVSEPILPDLGTARTSYQLPPTWNDVPVQDVGVVNTPAGGVFRGFADTELVQLNPQALDRSFFSDKAGNGTFSVGAAPSPGAPFATFVEPRARVFLKNLATNEQTAPIDVGPDGAFEAQIAGGADDAFQMHVYDQGRGDDALDGHRIVTFAGTDTDPVVAYSPHSGVPEPTDLIMETLATRAGALISECGVTPGSVVTVSDLETNMQTKAVADPAGSIAVSADLEPGRIFEIRVENPFVHAENEAIRAKGGSVPKRPGLERTVRVQVDKGGALTAVATDEFPPSMRTGHVAPASLGDRSFDPNTDVDFMPSKLSYTKNSRGAATGGVRLDLTTSKDLRAQGSVPARSLILSRDGSKLQIVLDPQLSGAVGMPKGEGQSFSSSIGTQHGGFPRNDSLSFRPGNFQNGYREHIDVEILRPDGSLMGTATMRPGETAFTDTHGEQVVDWSFGNFQKAEGVVGLLDINGLEPGAVRGPQVRPLAWIEPSKKYTVGTKMSTDELRAFSTGKVAGSLNLQLGIVAPQGYALSDIASIEVVNLTEHPGGFAEKGAAEKAKVNASEATKTALVQISKAATKRLGVHLDDQLQFRAVMNDGTTTQLTDPVNVRTTAQKTAVTVRGDFISAGVTTRWEQHHVGDTYQGSISTQNKDQEIEHTQAVIAPPPSRDAAGWRESVKLKKRKDGLVEMTWNPGSVPSGAKFSFRNYSLNSPYGTGSLYATTTYDREAPRGGERPRMVFRPPGEGGVIAIELGRERLIYPPKLQNDPRVKKTFG